MRPYFTITGVLGLILGGCHGAPPPAAAGDSADAAKPPVVVQVAKAQRRTVRQLLDVMGSFEPAQGGAAKLTPAVAGRVATVLVKEGDHVRKGQLLATLDLRVQQGQQLAAAAAAAAAQAQATSAQLSYQAAAADQASAVRTAEIGLRSAQLDFSNSVAQSTLAYEQARADLAKVKAGARPQEIAQAHEQTIQARVARDRAASESTRTQQLFSQGIAARRDADNAKSALETAESALIAARQNEELIRAGSRVEDLRAADARTAAARASMIGAKSMGAERVAAARAALQQARQGQLALRAKLQDVETSSATARQRQAESAAAGATTALAEIRSPYDGAITRRILNPGDAADTTTPVLEIAAGRVAADFVGNAVTAQASQISSGMLVEIEANGRQVSGRVLSVSPADVQTGLSSIRISCTTAALAGTFGVAHIVIKSDSNVVAAPDDTILDRDGKPVVLKLVDGAAKQVEVKVGPEDGGFTEIISGVAAGEQLIQTGGFELADGDKVTVQDEKAATNEKPAGAKD